MASSLTQNAHDLDVVNFIDAVKSIDICTKRIQKPDFRTGKGTRCKIAGEIYRYAKQIGYGGRYDFSDEAICDMQIFIREKTGICSYEKIPKIKSKKQTYPNNILKEIAKIYPHAKKLGFSDKYERSTHYYDKLLTFIQEHSAPARPSELEADQQSKKNQ